MVKLQKLVLRNFKSFKKADIPISKGFTAIVGSNGSGKTNILDALLFVMGTSSMKMLRASKMEELVNNSAVENYAKVDLHFKDKNRTYVVQRMINKQGKGIYRLDGKRKTRNEISSLLQELGIRPDGHNIVVQGDTTRVIEMSPIERRQIIDELAGLQEFDAKKEEALKALQKVDNKLRDAGIVMQERENYLEELRKDKDAASEFGNLQKENKSIKATILFSEIESNEKTEAECREKLESIGKGRKELEETIGESLSEKTKQREKAEKLNAEILAQKEKTYATVGAQLEEAKTGKALLHERIENRKNSIEKSRARAEELEGKAKRIDKEIEDQEERVEEINAELLELEKRIKEASGKKEELQAVAEEKEAKLRAMNDETEALSSELSSLNEKMFENKSLLHSSQKELELKKESMRETMKVIEGLDERIEGKEKKQSLLVQIEKKFPTLEQSLQKDREESEKVLDSLKEAEAEKKNLAEGIETLAKGFATCPICDSELTKEKKNTLSFKKEERMKELMQRENSHRQRRKDLAKRIEEMQNAKEKKALLVVETNDLKELRQSIKENREKLAGLKKWISENESGNLQKKVQELEEKAKSKKEIFKKQREKAYAFQESAGLTALQDAISQLNTLEKDAQSLEHEKESLQKSTAAHLQKQKKEALEEAKDISEENKGLDKKVVEEAKDLQEADLKVAKLEAKVLVAEKEGKQMIEEKEKLDKSILKIEDKVRDKQAKQRSLGQQENNLMIEKSKREVRLADLKEEFLDFKEIERIKEFVLKELQERLKAIDKRIEELGAINMKALASFNQLEAEVIDVRKKVEKLDEERLAVVEMIEKIDVKRTNVFMECFDELSKNFSKMFNTLFNGEGILELSNKEKPLEAGLLIQAKHKGNNIKNIDSMSGGEKTMTALAFLFAIQVYEPAPFYVFDEADAALDKENSIKMAKIIKEISLKSQFIAITHNDPLVQEANQIIGVAVNKQKSSVIGLKLREKFSNNEEA